MKVIFRYSEKIERQIIEYFKDNPDQQVNLVLPKDYKLPRSKLRGSFLRLVACLRQAFISARPLAALRGIRLSCNKVNQPIDLLWLKPILSEIKEGWFWGSAHGLVITQFISNWMP